MRKNILLTVALLLLAAAVYPLQAAAASETELPIDLGLDHNKLQWWISAYGTKDDGTPFVVARKYYTATGIREAEIERLMPILMSNGYPPEKAGYLQFTEYEYEYTKDGKQLAVAYMRHYDDAGNEIYGVVFDDATEDTQKTFVAIGHDPISTLGAEKGVLLVFPESASASK